MQGFTHPVETRYCCAKEGNLTVNIEPGSDPRLEYLAGDDGIVMGGKFVHQIPVGSCH